MQLKRDTEFALRILFCISERCLKTGEPPAGITLSELSTQSGVPKVIVSRICDELKDAGIILSKMSPNTEIMVFLVGSFSDKSLLDVIAAVEKTVQLFAVFDKKTPMYSACEDQMKEAQARLEAILSEMTLRKILKTEE